MTGARHRGTLHAFRIAALLLAAASALAPAAAQQAADTGGAADADAAAADGACRQCTARLRRPAPARPYCTATRNLMAP